MNCSQQNVDNLIYYIPFYSTTGFKLCHNDFFQSYSKVDNEQHDHMLIMDNKGK